MPLPYKRVLLKLSGESLKGDSPKDSSGIVHRQTCLKIAESIYEVYALGIELGIVVGGGNIFRGNMAKDFGLARTPADHVGMLATTINGLILAQILTEKGCTVRVMSALNFDGIVEPYNWMHALHAIQKKQIVIFVGGTGNPYFTTDTTAAMRASEIEADVLLKGTKVDGIYDQDPIHCPSAIKHTELSYEEVLVKKLGIMDAAAIALCRDNNLPIHVFNIFKEGSLKEVVQSRSGGTLIKQGETSGYFS